MPRSRLFFDVEGWPIPKGCLCQFDADPAKTLLLIVCSVHGLSAEDPIAALPPLRVQWEKS